MRGDRLREIREQRGLSQADLANRIGVAPQQIMRYEASKNLPSSAVLLVLSRELGVSADYLLGLVEYPHAKITPADISPLEYKFLSAADHGDLEEMIRVALEIYKDYQPDQNRGQVSAPQLPRKARKLRAAE